MEVKGDRRSKDLALIHCAKRDLGLDDETYRDVLWTVARVRSAKDLDDYGRKRVLQHFEGCGWKRKENNGRRRHPGRVPVDVQGYMGKIEAQLADMKLPWSYADGIARQMFRVDSLRFCRADQLRKVVAALSYEQKKREQEVPSG